MENDKNISFKDKDYRFSNVPLPDKFMQNV